MNDRASGNSTLYFLVGGLLVAVLAVGYFALGRGGSDAGSSAGVAATGSAQDTGSKFKLEVGKDGGVSGTVENTN